MTTRTILILGLASFLLTKSLASEATFEELFHIPKNDAMQVFGKHNMEIFEHALVDFNAVLAGREPLHAKLDPIVVTDGGTSYYTGKGYKITALKTLTSITNIEGSRVDGYIYGPILTFDSKVVAGNSSTMTRTSFYTYAALERLLKENK
jgi:hypothetical protein